MDREDFAGLVYILSSIAAALISSVCLVLYLMYKLVDGYLVGAGLLMLLTGFAAKKIVDASEKNNVRRADFITDAAADLTRAETVEKQSEI